MRLLCRGRMFLLILCALVFCQPTRAAQMPAKVYVILWFDTEDYILPASDDAALRVADFLTQEKIRATFKIVGEKGRTLERRGRRDVIEALSRHEIGFHANWHSTQPSPAMYLSDLGWDEGVAEFDRREGPGFDDITRIFGQKPTCYGQPGSSWAPQSFGAMSKWGANVYLDAGSHVGLDGKPHFYCGLLTLYNLAHIVRTGLASSGDLLDAEDRFGKARRDLLEEGGGIVSIYYHPCEFVHQQFWDGVNFQAGANPPREKWKLPPMKTPEESATAFRIFQEYVRFIRRFPEVEFITASQAARLYADGARGRAFDKEQIKKIAQQFCEGEITFHRQDGYALSASEGFLILNEFVKASSADGTTEPVQLDQTPLGPTQAPPTMTESRTTDKSQFQRTAADVSDFLLKQHRIPTGVWLGSTEVPPEAYLAALARVSLDLLDHKPIPENVEIKPARLKAAEYVRDDGPQLWGWVIFPRGFHAPALMELAKRQAWTIKPAILGHLE